jgi:predicted Zn-dependent protease
MDIQVMHEQRLLYSYAITDVKKDTIDVLFKTKDGYSRRHTVSFEGGINRVCRLLSRFNHTNLRRGHYELRFKCSCAEFSMTGDMHDIRSVIGTSADLSDFLGEIGGNVPKAYRLAHRRLTEEMIASGKYDVIFEKHVPYGPCYKNRNANPPGIH